MCATSSSDHKDVAQLACTSCTTSAALFLVLIERPTRSRSAEPAFNTSHTRLGWLPSSSVRSSHCQHPLAHRAQPYLRRACRVYLLAVPSPFALDWLRPFYALGC
eukprot:8856376-Pyramimonas_sp.AAC.1